MKNSLYRNIRNILTLASFSIMVLATCGCWNEDDATRLYLFAEASSKEAVGGEKMFFDIDATTLNDEIVLFRAEMFDPEHGTVVFHEECPGVRKFHKRVVADIPPTSKDSLNLEFRFTVEDDAGLQFSRSRHMVVRKSISRALEEITGIEMYSPLSGKPDAFSLVKKRTVVSSDVKETDLKDLDIVFREAGVQSDALPLAWTSGTDVVFTLLSEFDYPAATESGVKEVFRSSRKNPSISGLKAGDLILVGRESYQEEGGDVLRSEACGVIKIVSINDGDGVEEDRIVFDYKYI